MIRYALKLGLSGALALALFGVSSTVAKGEPFSLSEENGKYVVEAGFRVEATTKLAWEVLTDYERIPEFVESVQSSKVKERKPDSLRLDQELKASYLFFTKQSKVSLRVVEKRPTTISFKDESRKSFDIYVGSWTIAPNKEHAGSVNVTYQLTAKPNFSVPSTIVSIIFEKKAKELLDGVQAEIVRRKTVIHPTGELVLEGTSTLHGWSSKATQIQMWLHVVNAKDGTTTVVRDLDKWREVVSNNLPVFCEVVIPVKGMISGEGKLDEKLNDALKSEEHPSIRFRMSEYAIRRGSEDGDVADGIPVRAKGKLVIAGKEKSVELDITVRFTETGVRIQGSKALLMTEFDVDPPKLMGGIIKAHDPITIRFDLEAPLTVSVGNTVTN
ncbi:MAG: YceI family protein [Candidatus Poribacteria bacterium]|nr:YceI family protein [Candidatus Poribacteria bacterium]